MASNIATSLYGLSASELRELVLVLCMEKKAKDTVTAHIGVMRGASSNSQYPTTPTQTQSKAAVERDPFKSPSSAGSSPGARHPLPGFLTSSIQPTKINKTSIKTASKKKQDLPTPISVKRTPLYHDCKNCRTKFRQQDNGVYSCWHHPGKFLSPENTHVDRSPLSNLANTLGTGQLVDTNIDSTDERSLRSSTRAKYSCCGSTEDSLGCRYGRHVADDK